MTIDEAEEIVNQLTDFYGRKKLTTTALKFWCRGLAPLNRLAAGRALQDVWDSYTTMPTRQAFIQAAHARQLELFPPKPTEAERVEPWEEKLGAAVIGYFMRYLAKKDTLNDWANNFRAVARAQGVEDRIDWKEWEQTGAQFYI